MKTLRILAALAPLFVSACGGGSPSAPRDGGNFTLSKSEMSFRAAPGGNLPEQQGVAMTLTDHVTRYVGAGFATAPDPGWLNVYMDGYDPNFAVMIVPNTTAMSEGVYTTVVTVGTANGKGDILKTQDIQVTYTVDKPVDIQNWFGYVELPQFVLGHSTHEYATSVTVNSGEDDLYEASSNAAWLIPPETTFQGPQEVPFSVDVAGLGVGMHTAVLTMQNTQKDWDKDTLQVRVTIAAPELSLVEPTALIGGSSGLELAASPLKFSVNTGTRAHPFTATLTTNGGGNWMLADATDGTVSSVEQQVALNADRIAVQAGVYTGNVKIDVDVDGYVVTKNVPVTFNRATEKILVTADGVALSQLPSREVLTRDVRVLSTLDRTDIPWTASSDQGWLAVTGSGLTGEALTLTANPLLLAQDTLHEATVTVTSSDPGVTNTEHIRVGLWIASAGAVPVELAAGPRVMVMDPVAPLMYTHTYTNSISVYNVYTGALVTSYPSGTTSSPVGLAISSDGRTLFVHEFPSRTTTGETPAQAVALSTADGEVLETYDFSVFGYAYNLAYGRPDARPMLYSTAGGRAIDVATKQVFTLAAGWGIHATPTADNRYVLLQTEGPYAVRAKVRHSTLGGNAIHTPQFQQYILAGGNDVAVSADGLRVYGIDATPFTSDTFDFPVFNALTSQVAGSLPGVPFPNNVETAWNGVFAGGATAPNDAVDLWFYGAGDVLLGSDSCSGAAEGALVENTVRFSGDALRYACVSYTSNSSDTRKTWIRDVPGS